VVEIELKFQTEPARREAVRRAVLGTGATAQSIRLQARYFDTADGRLASAGLALRLRREGRTRWVQTLKGRGDGLMRRLEHEVVLPTSGPAELDLVRHDGTPAGAALRAALGSPPAALLESFATDIRRTRRVAHAKAATGEMATIEIAFDEGSISALDGEGMQRLAVAEVEFELTEGSPQALLAMASRWVQRYGLWLDVRSKAELGRTLATRQIPDAVTAQPALVSRRMSPVQALAAMVQSALGQVLPNLAVIAQASQAGPEHVHQLRVGLRRLRTALREFGADVDSVDAQWDPMLAQVFRRLGTLRDRDVVANTLAAARDAARRAGLDAALPQLEPAPSLNAQDMALLRGRALHRLLLALIGLAMTAEQPAHGRSLVDVARKRLSRLHNRVAAEGAQFDRLDDAARHTLRKRLKRLRYSIEFVVPLFRGKAVTRYLALLKAAQDALGDWNDVVLALATFATGAPPTAVGAFQLGWLSARRDALAADALSRLQALSEARRFWKA
jgi:inorganic triphosphatase YgiF